MAMRPRDVRTQYLPRYSSIRSPLPLAIRSALGIWLAYVCGPRGSLRTTWLLRRDGGVVRCGPRRRRTGGCLGRRLQRRTSIAGCSFPRRHREDGHPFPGWGRQHARTRFQVALLLSQDTLLPQHSSFPQHSSLPQQSSSLPQQSSSLVPQLVRTHPGSRGGKRRVPTISEPVI